MSAALRILLLRRASLPALLLAGLVVAAGPGPAAAVILAPGDGTGNVEAPDDDFGFANVADAGETAVYLGNGWMITANHVRPRNVTLAGGVYEVVPGSKLRLRSDGARVSADLAIFRLQEPLPALPSLPIREAPPRVGNPVILVGNGPDRGDPVEVGERRGWEWARSHRLRWGTNQVHETGLEVRASVGDHTTAFSMRLSPTHPTPYECGVGLGDSGGAAFIEHDGRYELAGVLFAAKTFDDQPARTTLYGNMTFAADLSVYRDQILAITLAPACRDGLDDDGDGRVDFPADPGCASGDDDSESEASPPQD